MKTNQHSPRRLMGLIAILIFATVSLLGRLSSPEDGSLLLTSRRHLNEVDEQEAQPSEVELLAKALKESNLQLAEGMQKIANKLDGDKHQDITSLQLVQGMKDIANKLGDNAKSQDSASHSFVEGMQKITSQLSENLAWMQPVNEKREMLRGASNNIGNDAKRLRLEKYVNVYNYTAPWETFHGPTSECGQGPDYKKFFQQPGTKHSRYKEDQVVYERLFKNQMKPGETGTYVELGAFDGISEANTRFFDLCLGWKGLLIEGNPRTFPKTRLERPRTHRISFAPSCSEEYERTKKTVEFHAVIWANAGQESTALSFKGSPKATVAVPCGPLSPVLEDLFEGERINFFSLDVEGAEILVLDTIDFSKVQIDVIMIEVENNDCRAGEPCKKRDKIREMMTKLGYQKYEGVVRASDLYVHKDSPYQMDQPKSVKG